MKPRKARTSIANLTLEILRKVQSDVSELKTDMREVKTDVAGLKTDVAELKTDVAELKTDMREVKADIRDLKEGQRTHEKAIVKLIREQRATNERLDNFIQGAHQQEHADLRARVARLEATASK